MNFFWLINFVAIFSLVVAEIVELTDETFEKEWESGNWLIKFHAPWCNHCKKLRPIFEQLSHMKHSVKVGAVDVTVNKKVKERFEIEKFPTILYKKGNTVGNYDG